MAKQQRKSSRSINYYEWTTEPLFLRGDEVLRCAKPGMAAAYSPDPAHLLLAENLQVEEGDNVLCLNCGSGLAGVVAARESRGGQIVLADGNVVATEAASRTLAANDVKGVQAIASSGTRQLPDGLRTLARFDVVTVLLPKGKQLALQLILDGYNALRPGGKLYLAGANDEGIKPHLRNLELLCGSSVLLGYRKGCRVAAATKGDAPANLPKPFNELWLSHDHIDHFEVAKVSETAGRSVQICTMPGVFAAAKLDQGTAVLLDHMEIRQGERVLDLGCGTGILGTVAAIQSGGGSTVMADADVNAVEAAQQTLATNAIANAKAVLSDGIAQLEGQPPFDVVVTNPPFHQGKGTQYDAGIQFIADSAKMLKDGGRLYLVANQFLKYESEVDRHLGQCKMLFSNGRFKVLRGIKNPK